MQGTFSYLARIDSHISDVFQDTRRQSAIASPIVPQSSAQALLAKILDRACEERDFNSDYAKKIISGDFNFDRATPETVARIFRDADRIFALCSDAKARLNMDALFSSNPRADVSEMKADLDAANALCEESLVSALANSERPREILRLFHEDRSIRANSLHMSVILGIETEPVEGLRHKHFPIHHDLYDKQGGNRYEATELHWLRDLFSSLQIRRGSHFLDLGSGYGHPTFYLANVRSDLKCEGIELMPARVAECERVRQAHQFSNVTFRAANALDVELSRAQVVFLYNPFPQEIKEVMKQRLCDVARKEPLIVIDYQGLFLGSAPQFRRMDIERSNPFQVYGSRELYDKVLLRTGYVLPPR